MDHRLGHQQPSAHAAGQAAGVRVGLTAETDGGEDVVGAAVVFGDAVEAGLDLEHLARRKERVDIELLGHDADGPPGGSHVLLDVVAPDVRRAGGADHQPGEDVDQRRLAGAVGPEKPEKRAGGNAERDVFEGGDSRFAAASGVGFAEIDRLDGVVWKLLGGGVGHRICKQRGGPVHGDIDCRASIAIIRPAVGSTTEVIARGRGTSWRRTKPLPWTNLLSLVDGGGGPLGHPLVYLHTDDDGEVVCPYCSRHFVLAAGADTQADH